MKMLTIISQGDYLDYLVPSSVHLTKWRLALVQVTHGHLTKWLLQLATWPSATRISQMCQICTGGLNTEAAFFGHLLMGYKVKLFVKCISCAVL